MLPCTPARDELAGITALITAIATNTYVEKALAVLTFAAIDLLCNKLVFPAVLNPAHKFKRVLFYTRQIQRFLQRDTDFKIREYEKTTQQEE